MIMFNAGEHELEFRGGNLPVRIFLSPFLIHIVMLKGIIKVGHCFDVFSVSSAAFHGPGQEKTGNQNAEDSLQVSGKTRSAHGRTPSNLAVFIRCFFLKAES